MARKIKENNCSNCAKLLTCLEILTYTCKSYVRAEPIKVMEPEEKPAISKRNKEIVKLVEQGLTVEEIAEKLELKPETVRKEIEFLTKIGVLMEVKVKNKLSAEEATLKQEGSKVIVLKPA